jgi:2-polyprenyl-3-methyl-5-hydroxy-6-metoxy-1,4-benzoquinol methylase
LFVSRETLKSMENITNCFVCGGKEFSQFNTCLDYTVSRDKFTIVKCKDCGFIFTNPRPDSNEIVKYYESEDYISHSDSSKGIINYLYKKVRNYTINKKVRLVNSLSKDKTILDIGCGTGAFLNACKTNGWVVEGIEPSESAREFAKQNYDLNINPEDRLATFANNSFSIISMWHVLEHVHLLNDRIEELKGLIKKDGTIIIAVPNCDSRDADYYSEFWAAYDLPRHLYHFTPNTMDKLMDKHQLKIVKKLPMIFDAYYVSMLSEKYKNGKISLLKALLKGYKSNKVGKRDINKFSSVIYIIKEK